MKNSLLLFCFCVLFASCQQAEKFRIEGSAPPATEGKYVMLFRMYEDSIVSVDTTTIHNNSFSFSGTPYVEDFSIIVTGDYPEQVYSSELLLEKGKIKVLLDSISIVSGTPLNNAYNNYNDSCKYFGGALDKEIFFDEKLQMRRYSLEGEKLSDAYSQYTYRYIKNNISNILGKREFIQRNRGLRPDVFSELYLLSDTITRSNWKIQDAKKEIEYDNWFKDSIIVCNQIFHTPNGESRKLSDYIGKSEYLFIDFWASWCAPCIQEIPAMKKIYATYKNEGLEIISISLDTDESQWKKSVKQQNMSWPQLTDFLGYKSEFIRKYQIKGIPDGILVDKNGRIIKCHVNGSILPAYLELSK